MQAVANNKAFAKKVGVPQSVGKEFTMKKTKKYASGATVGTVNKSAGTAPGGNAAARTTRMTGRYNTMADRFGDKVTKMTTRANTMTGDRKTQLTNRATAMNTKFGTRLADFAKKHNVTVPTKKAGGTMKKYAAGGLTAGHKAADGIAKKGKTKGKEVAMKKGGKMKGGSC